MEASGRAVANYRGDLCPSEKQKPHLHGAIQHRLLAKEATSVLQEIQARSKPLCNKLIRARDEDHADREAKVSIEEA
ncbi:unnamed protein product [Gadus morhua 'NCC']